MQLVVLWLITDLFVTLFLRGCVVYWLALMRVCWFNSVYVVVVGVMLVVWLLMVALLVVVG